MNIEPESVAASFHEQGYAVVRDVFSKAKIAEYQAESKRLHDQYSVKA